jgi:hypothetical protein
MKKGNPSKYANAVIAPGRADHVRYEQRKMQWSSTNPNATQAEFEHAMRCIAKSCGV